MPTYTSSNGRSLEISAMNDVHITNALKKMVDKAKAEHKKEIVHSGTWKMKLPQVAHQLNAEMILRGKDGLI